MILAAFEVIHSWVMTIKLWCWRSRWDRLEILVSAENFSLYGPNVQHITTLISDTVINESAAIYFARGQRSFKRWIWSPLWGWRSWGRNSRLQSGFRSRSDRSKGSNTRSNLQTHYSSISKVRTLALDFSRLRNMEMLMFVLVFGWSLWSILHRTLVPTSHNLWVILLMAFQSSSVHGFSLNVISLIFKPTLAFIARTRLSLKHWKWEHRWAFTTMS